MSDKKIVSKSKDAYIKRKKDMNFQSVESMQSVVNVVNEAAAALNDKRRTIRESAIPEVLAGALGAGIGGVGSFAALYGLGVVGLSAAGITSSLATAGTIVGGGMVAAVGYAMVINMMSTKETWPFFALGFVLAAIGELTLIALGAIGVALAIIYLGLKENSGSNGGGSTGSGDPLGDILNDY